MVNNLPYLKIDFIKNYRKFPAECRDKNSKLDLTIPVLKCISVNKRFLRKIEFSNSQSKSSL